MLPQRSGCILPPPPHFIVHNQLVTALFAELSPSLGRDGRHVPCGQVPRRWAQSAHLASGKVRICPTAKCALIPPSSAHLPQGSKGTYGRHKRHSRVGQEALAGWRGPHLRRVGTALPPRGGRRRVGRKECFLVGEGIRGQNNAFNINYLKEDL